MALVGVLALPHVAAAQSIAYAAPGRTNMRAGPGLDFPVIAQILGGSAVNVYGCLADFSWCDTSVQNVRGWVSTTRLEFDYGGNLVPLPRYYSSFNAPVILFDFGYWDRHYRDRPFYRHRHRDRQPNWPDDDGGASLPEPGIFPEEGGPRDDNDGRIDNSPPPMIEGPGTDGQVDDGGATIFPEEGGAASAPEIIEIQPPSEEGGALPPCAAEADPNCQ
jgi:uncharacterized protein YraI